MVGIKGYSFDLVAINNPRDLPKCNAIFIFGCMMEESHEEFTITSQVEGNWRITGYGDIAGSQNFEIDEKRVQQLYDTLNKHVIKKLDPDF